MLTDAIARSLDARESVYEVRDSRCLYFRVDTAGRKYWILKMHFDKKLRVRSLGSYPKVSIEEARARRDAIQFERSTDGSVVVLKPKERCFGELVKKWLKVRMTGRSKAYMKTVRLRLDKYILPALASKDVDKITSAEILEVCHRIQALGYADTAHRVRGLIGQILRFGVASGIAKTDPTSVLRGALAPHHARHYPTFTHGASIGHLMRSLRAYPYSVLRCALLFSVYTFARPGEVRHAEWSEIDRTSNLWIIPATKMKMRRPHLVPLSRGACTILDELEKITGDGRWLFPSPVKEGIPFSDSAMRVALRSMGFEKGVITPHGFRAMASTILNTYGFAPDVIERQLAHQDRNKVRAAYNHSDFFVHRQIMMQWWSDYLDEVEKCREHDSSAVPPSPIGMVTPFLTPYPTAFPISPLKKE